MYKPVVISVSPMKSKLMYHVKQKKIIMETFLPISYMDRIIIFCSSYDEVTTLYQFFKRRLGNKFVCLMGAPNKVRYRVVAKYTHCTYPSVKESIIQLFTKESQLRVVIGTIAFGMGFN